MDYAEIPLSNGEKAKVSLQDADLVNQFTWHCERRGAKSYAVAYLAGRKFYMHDFVMRVALTFSPRPNVQSALRLDA